MDTYRCQPLGCRPASSAWQLLLHSVVAALIALTTAASGNAQDNPGVTFNFSGGVSPLLGDITDRLSTGAMFSAGAGYRFNSRFSESVQFSYYAHGVKQALLDQAQVPDGNAHTWSLTLDPKLELFPRSKNRPYVIGGFGYYRRTVEFTQPALLSEFYFDPFFDVLISVTVPANQVLSESKSSGIGGSLGGGFEFKLRDGPSLFAEARYHYADTGGIKTKMVPVSFGIRW